MFINSVIADATSARLDAYKANRLIPQEIKLPTPETTEGDSEEVVVFTSNALSWSTESAWTVKYADYMGLSKEDWESVGNFFDVDSGTMASGLRGLLNTWVKSKRGKSPTQI